jgi:hypothetical protein
MASVEMVNGHPIELRCQILLHAIHQAPGQRFQVIILVTIFRETMKRN